MRFPELFQSQGLYLTGKAPTENSYASYPRFAGRLEVALILSIGSEPELLLLRTRVLENAGRSVVTVSNLDYAVAIFNSASFNGVIFCHPLPGAVRDAIVREMMSTRSAPVFVFQKPVAPGADASLKVFGRQEHKFRGVMPWRSSAWKGDIRGIPCNRGKRSPCTWVGVSERSNVGNISAYRFIGRETEIGARFSSWLPSWNSG